MSAPVLLEPKVIKDYNPLLFYGKELFAAKGNKLYRFNATLDYIEDFAFFPEGFLKDFLVRNALYKRVLRKGIHGLAVDRQANMVAVANKQLLFRKNHEKTFRPVFNRFRGSRPLKIEYSQGLFCFGEYFGNPNRESVHIFTSEDGQQWERSFTFPAGSIRHVHGILDDPERNGSWVFTGDNNKESKIWFSDDGFRTLDPVVEGSQKARAVNIIASHGALIIPMDSPLEQNYIQRYDLNIQKLQLVAAIPGSAFHAIESDGIMLVSTVTEPSEINKTNAATLWGSLDGINWKCVCELEKDIFPVRWQHIFRYAEIVLTPGENDTPYITAFGRALRGRCNCMLVWKKEELRRYLS